MQKIDKELESALATLDKEKEEALKDLDAQVCHKSSLQIGQGVAMHCTTWNCSIKARLDVRHLLSDPTAYCSDGLKLHVSTAEL